MQEIKENTAIYIGRFQPFHNGHFGAVKHITSQYKRLIIAIGSAQESFTTKNPYSASERFEMIYRTLQDAGITNCLIVPIDDINRNDMWVAHVCSKAPEFQTVFSNNKLTCALFAKAGFTVKNIPRVGAMTESATRIRQLMGIGMKWKQYVPETVYAYIREKKLDERLSEIE